MRDLNTKYIEFRHNYEFLIYKATFLGLIVGVALWRNSIFYIVAIIFILTLIEAVLVKCPNCNKRPVRFWRQFPATCRHCEKNLLREL